MPAVGSFDWSIIEQRASEVAADVRRFAGLAFDGRSLREEARGDVVPAADRCRELAMERIALPGHHRETPAGDGPAGVRRECEALDRDTSRTTAIVDLAENRHKSQSHLLRVEELAHPTRPSGSQSSR